MRNHLSLQFSHRKPKETLAPTLEVIRRSRGYSRNSPYDYASVAATYDGLKITKEDISIGGYVMEDDAHRDDPECEVKYYRLHRSSAQPDDSEYFVKHWCPILRVEKKPELFIDELIRSVCPWSNLEHRNIAPFIGIIGPDVHGYLGIITPYYKHGDIVSYLDKNPGVDVLPLLHDIADALSYIHLKGLVHGELKGSNIMIDNDHNVRLTDLGQMNLFEELQFAGERGSAKYRLRSRDNFLFVAPELLKTFLYIGSRKTLGLHTPESDIYAFAMAMYQIYTRRRPYADEPLSCILAHDIWYKDRRPLRPSANDAPQLGNDMWELIADCWATLPGSRPSTDEIKSCIHMVQQDMSELPLPSSS